MTPKPQQYTTCTIREFLKKVRHGGFYSHRLRLGKCNPSLHFNRGMAAKYVEAGPPRKKTKRDLSNGIGWAKELSKEKRPNKSGDPDKKNLNTSW